MKKKAVSPRKRTGKSESAVKGRKQSVKSEDDAETLLQRATDAMVDMQLELAAKLFGKALVLSPEDTNLMDALADVLIQLGSHDEARQLLLRSTATSPDANPFKWLFLAQLQSGKESVATYERAIGVLCAQAEAREDAEERRIMQKQIVKAYCSIADIFLTDLWYGLTLSVALFRRLNILTTLCLLSHQLRGSGGAEVRDSGTDSSSIRCK